jgi:hypothetical protein
VSSPGSATAAAVLGFVQAGITAVATGLILAGLVSAGGGVDEAFGWVLVVAQSVGIFLLVYGGVRLLRAGERGAFVGGAVLELLICVYYAVRFLAVPVDGFALAEHFRSAGVVTALLFAVLPAAGLILCFRQAARGRRG